MISVEEWRLKMTENVQRTFDRLTGSSRKASESFTRTQEKLNEGTRNMGREAQRVQQQLDRTGGGLNRLFGRLRFQAKELFGGMRQGWRDALDERGINKFSDVFKRMGNPFKSMRGSMGNLFGSGGKSFAGGVERQLGTAMSRGMQSGAARGLAGLLPRLASMAGPVGMALAVAAGVAMKGYSAAKAFDPSARELRLANLGKTPAEQTALRDQVLGMAGNNGFNAQEATSAFIAVQRTSGASTTAVNGFVSEVGKAAGALNMDFMPMVAGSAKVLKDFGLPLERATDLLDSNVKAMAAGKVTYDMLAKAQADFASGARLANQRLDTANSLYAVFAANGNDASQAGDRLTSAMEGLRHTNTIKAFKDIGVNVLDAQGQLRQMDEVVRELVPHLAGMNNARFDALKQQFAGNEGMVELLDLARGNSEKLLGTLDQFKNSKLGISEQLEAAKNDLDLTAKQIEERMNTAWINIGNSMRPMFQQFQKFMLWIAEGFVGMADPVTMNAQRGIRAAQEYAAAQKERVDKLAAPASTGTAEERQRGMADLYRERTKLQYAYDVSVKNGIDSNAKRFKEQLLENRMAITSANAAWGKMAKPNGTGPETPGTTSLITDKGGNDPLKQGATAIVGGGKQVRNVNVTIQKLVEKLEVRTAGTVREGISNVRQQVEQALVDIVRGGEAALANG